MEIFSTQKSRRFSGGPNHTAVPYVPKDSDAKCQQLSFERLQPEHQTLLSEIVRRHPNILKLVLVGSNVLISRMQVQLAGLRYVICQHTTSEAFHI